MFDRKSLKLLHKLLGHGYGGQTVALQCGILYSGSKDCSVRSWDLIAGRQLSCARDHRDLDLTTDATRVVSGSKDHQVKVWDTKTGSLLLSLTQDAEITCLSVYPLIPGQ